MPGRMQNKIVMVTGAGSIGPGWGNGKAGAVLMAREGARVFAIDRTREAVETTKQLIEAEGGECTTHVADVTNAAVVDAMVDRCVGIYERIDALYNNVGAPLAGGVTQLDEADWDKQMNVNLKHVFLVTRAVVRMMQERRSGSIVNIGSICGLTFSGQQQIAYQTAKAAVVRFSRSVALEYAPVGIRCNTVIPGLMHTPMVEACLADQQTGGDIQTLLDKRNARIPMGFMGTAWDVANAVLFLASDEARYVTGAEIVVDGGVTLKCADT